MQIYLASPNTQQQAEHVSAMNVLLSFASYSKWLDQYHPSFRRVLIDSWAYSEMNSGKKIDLIAYRDWSQKWVGYAEAVAGLDDISGDYKKGMKNFEAIEWTFPTWHDTDPLEIVPELVEMARERKTWLGIGLMPPRHRKERVIRAALEQIPEDIHVHGWALRTYSYIRRFDSLDSTNWWRDGMAVRQQLPWLHYGEALELVVKRYQREATINRTKEVLQTEQQRLFHV